MRLARVDSESSRMLDFAVESLAFECVYGIRASSRNHTFTCAHRRSRRSPAYSPHHLMASSNPPTLQSKRLTKSVLG